MKEIIISSSQAEQTVCKFVKKYLNEAPLSFIEKLFRIKDVKINGKRVNKNVIIHEGDIIQIYVSDQQLSEFNKPVDITLIKNMPNIIYEDENILVCSKPKGLLVHGDEREKRMTLSNMVLSYLYQKGEYNPRLQSGFVPGPAHRIDRNTSGIVIFGKNIKSLQALEDMFKERSSLHKYYLALVCGTLTTGGKIDLPLFKDEQEGIVMVKPVSQGGKEALTEFEVKENFKYYTLVEASLITGRTHQIRVHFQGIKHPLVGDGKYGNIQTNRIFEKKFKYKGQFLHAYKMKFDEVEGVLSYLSNKEFVCPLNEKEEKILSQIRKEQ